MFGMDNATNMFGIDDSRNIFGMVSPTNILIISVPYLMYMILKGFIVTRVFIFISLNKPVVSNKY